MNKLNQKGFAALEAILIIVALLIAGGTGYYIYSANKKTSNTLNTASKVASSSPPKTTKKKPSKSKSTSSSAANGQKYLVIKEWGVELPLSNSIQDAYYTYHADGDYVRLGTKSLTAMSAMCAPDDISIAAVTRQTAVVHDANATQNDPVAYPVNATKIGNYYYSISQAQAACGNAPDDAASQQQAADIKLFKTAFQGIQATQ